jgi:hypothetical protein
MHWIRFDVFISYSHQDSRVVTPLVIELRRRGYRVFFDTQSIAVGEQWKRRLGKAVGSSRVCLLCWSEHAKKSEYVVFEYSRAEAQGKRVFPWLLDDTPLPSMLEVHGIVDRDPSIAADQFTRRLRSTLSFLRKLEAIAILLLLVALGFGYWRTHLPPPPWDFSGRVIDSETRSAIAGVEVDAEQRYTTFTDTKGRYIFHMPPPRPKYIHLIFSKQGYKGREPVAVVAADGTWDVDMTRIK